MEIGLIDVDGHNFPNLPLMKLSAWHKQQGDAVGWYEPLLHGFPNAPLDRVYMSKVFSFTPDYPYYRYEDKRSILPKFKAFKEITGWDKRKLAVYVLVNFDTTIEQDLERIYTLRDLGFWPYVMVYGKEHTKPGDTVRKIQRWVNMRAVFDTVKDFNDYGQKMRRGY